MSEVPIVRQHSLASYNTFGIDVQARRLAHIRDESTLRRLLPIDPENTFVLGGGSNLLLTQDIDKLVLLNQIPGITLIEHSGSSVLIKAGGGVSWHALTKWAVNQGYGGIENLSLIPGTVGAAPIQNIGAYGVELREVFDRLEAYDLATGRHSWFTGADCHFGYRDSVFKNELKGKLIITQVYLRLHRNPWRVCTEYGAIRDTLGGWAVQQPTIRDVARAVIHIRRQKLPDPAELGNSGSFFKNPVVDATTCERLRADFPNLVYYALPGGMYKIPAGWLIEQCGWKGKRVGQTGCYEKQALVLVNYGGASGREVYAHAQRVMDSVQERFGIILKPEVNII